MAPKTLTTQGKIYTKIEGELASTGLDIPATTATLTNFKALANMTPAGSVLVEVDGIEYAVPIVLNA